MKLQKKQSLAQKRRWRIRKKVQGSAARPRLSVHFSNKHIYAQCIDDVKGHTLAYVTKAAGIDSVVFDRGGRRYHGCVKSFAEAAREGGLQF